MAEKSIYESPSVTDTVVIPISTPDASGCLIQNPYKVDNLTIYYVERDFSRGNVTEFEAVQKNEDAEKAASDAQNVACVTPTASNIEKAKRLRAAADSYQTTQAVYYNEAVPVAVIGTTMYPAWLSSDTDNAFIENIPEDDDGNPIYGTFRYIWNPVGMREGNYFACWTWTPLSAGESLSANASFILMGNTVVTTSIPTHFTPKEKYDVLLERYLPEMYKDALTDQDLSPTVLNNFNGALAKGFTSLENLANQIVDLPDSNATHEAFLSLLARNFGMTLRSNDPTRWRRQIKRAVPLYKKKGTIGGLKEAFELAGMKLTRLVRLWQMISPYTWVESFVYDGSDSYPLTKVALAIDPDNFEFSTRKAADADYTVQNNSNVQIVTADGISSLELINGIEDTLEPGDRIKVMYQYAVIPNPTQQDVEDYIRLLPLGDTRDDAAQDYPPKNWNVRMLEEDDPLFSVLIPTKNPYHDYLVFGKIRTEFPYSENVYNMEEYNGSIRESKDPCHIDKDFVDPCDQCLGSKFVIDVDVENLSNDRIMEARNIIEDYVPFHAVPQTINFSGSVNDFVQPPVETIECLILYKGSETVISGEAQMVFNRAMIDNGRPLTEVFRNTLASSAVVAFGNATAYNQRVMVFSPDVALDRVGMSKTPSQTVMEIYGPHAHAGKYQLTNAVNHSAEIYGSISPTATLAEPVNQSAFSFSLSNIIYTGTNTSIVQDNIYTLLDSTWNLAELGIKSQWDVDNTSYAGQPWKIKMTAYSATPFNIANTLPSGSILLAHNASLPSSNATNVAYQILKPDNTVVHTGNLVLTVEKRGLVTIDDAVLTDIRTKTQVGGTSYLYYQDTGVQYTVVALVEGQPKQFYISDWVGGSVAGKTIDIYQRLVDTQYGLLTYDGIRLLTTTNLESSLSISNGTNPAATPLENSRFKENFLIKLTNVPEGMTDEFFGIADIDGTTITLDGDMHYWTTLGNGGTAVTFEILRYQTAPVTVDGVDFQRIDRRGSEVISSTTEAAASFAMASMAASGGPEFADAVRQEEQITFRIEYRDGTVEEGSV